MDMVRDMKKTAGRRSFYAFFCLRAGGWVLRRPGGEQVLRLRARDGAFRAPARVTFFFCKKKVAKGNHSNLRFKDPLARGQAGVAPVGAGWGVSCPGTSNFLLLSKEKYSLQGTTQGRYLTGGVPPVRFSM